MKNESDKRKMRYRNKVFVCHNTLQDENKCGFLIRSVIHGNSKVKCPYCGYEELANKFNSVKMSKIDILKHNTSKKYNEVPNVQSKRK